MMRGVRFARRLLAKSVDDDVFFMAGAIAFNLIVGVLPLLILALGVAGFVLQARFTDPGAQAVLALRRILPAGTLDPSLMGAVEGAVDGAIAARRGISILGGILLVWFSTRLSATLRSVLRVVFETPARRGLVRGKLFDVQITLVGGLLVIADVAVTAFLTGIDPIGQLAGLPLTLLLLWALFALIFRYLPAEVTPWPTVLVAATVSAVTFAVVRIGFGWYIRDVATFTSTFGSLATVIGLYLFLYYSAVLFVLGGEVAYLSTHPEGRTTRRPAPVADDASGTLDPGPGV